MSPYTPLGTPVPSNALLCPILCTAMYFYAPVSTLYAALYSPKHPSNVPLLCTPMYSSCTSPMHPYSTSYATPMHPIWALLSLPMPSFSQFSLNKGPLQSPHSNCSFAYAYPPNPRQLNYSAGVYPKCFH